jgi:predicted SAM-dependent methyltransferase
MFYPELEGIDFLLGAVFYINGLTEESTFFARREKAKFPNSSIVGHLLDALGGATACLGSGATANDAHMGIKSSLNQVTAPLVVKLYAGDIPERPEYDGWIGLSLTKSDHRHILHDITTPFQMADNSVDAFQTEDVLEHIQYEKLPTVLNEIFRVLKPGALYRLSVPDYGCDVLRERSVKDVHGNIIFDPGGGGTPEDPGHLWFPRIESVYRMLEKTRFHTEGRMDFLHYWDMNRPTFVMRPIDYSKGFVKRTPDHDERVKAPYRPMSIVIDLYKGEDTINYPITTLGNESFESHISLTKKQQLC